jgi:hypothetical protein
VWSLHKRLALKGRALLEVKFMGYSISHDEDVTIQVH